MSRLERTPPTTPVTQSQSEPDIGSAVHHSDISYVNTSRQKRLRTERSPSDLNLQEFQNEIKDMLYGWKKEQETCLSKMISDQTAMMSKLFSEVSDIKLQNIEIQKTNTEIEKSIMQINREHEKVKMEVGDFQNKLHQLNATIYELSHQLRLKEQQARMNNLEISGIPMSKGENLYNIINTISVKIGITLNPTDVDYIHRVRRYPSAADNKNMPGSNINIPNIIVRFTQRKQKCNLLAAARARRGLTTADLGFDGAAKSIFINDHLSPQNKLLYKNARQIGKDKGYKYIWISDCKIFLRKNDASKSILIAVETDLTKII